MFSKIISFAALLAVVASQADRYPAGVNPQLCPNYPICDNSVLATYNNPPAPQYNSAPQYQPQYNPVPQYQPQYNPAPLAAPAAAQYPAGVSPASCPNYPYCSTSPAGQAAPPLPGFSARLYPDGVSPAACPNYPYCN